MNSLNFKYASEVSSVSAVPTGMSEFETFAAICKGYCAINILVLPKQFDNGGWVIGLLSINFGCLFVLYCAIKLVECA